MTLTPEQFNKIATKEDLNNLKEELTEKMMTKDEKNEILDVLDTVVKKLDNIENDSVANKAAHDRIQTDVNEVRKYVKMDVKNPVVNDGE